MANDLKPYEDITRVFWIKIELKENQKSGRQALGDIKDVMSGDKQLIYELHDIIHFILPYLENMGIKIHWRLRLGSWLIRKRRKNNFGLSNPTPEDGEHRANS
jgi:hypothetical protein